MNGARTACNEITRKLKIIGFYSIPLNHLICAFAPTQSICAMQENWCFFFRKKQKAFTFRRQYQSCLICYIGKLKNFTLWYKEINCNRSGKRHPLIINNQFWIECNLKTPELSSKCQSWQFFTNLRIDHENINGKEVENWRKILCK